MKFAAITLVGLGLVFSGFAAAVPNVNELAETLSHGPWAELPMRVVAVVRHAKAHDRRETTIVAVKAALGINPAAATAVVGTIARMVPNMAAVAAETAAAEDPKQAPEIALAAAAGAHSSAIAGEIVTGVCRVAPTQYASVALAVAEAVPGAGKEILLGLEIAQPDLKLSIDQVLVAYQGHVPSVGLVLVQASGTAAHPIEKAKDNGNGGTPPGLDGVVPPGQGGTPPGHGGIPPGQYKKLQD